jgi:TonB family protein
MPSQPIPDPNLPPLVPSAAGGIRAQADDRSFETDFAALAARFVSRSGGGLSPDLAADLALEIVLHEIAEQACMETGATGAAIVLHRNGEFTCRARYGKNAPELGSRLAADGALSAECIRTGLTQRCDDVEADARVDAEASRQLGVLSLLVLPLHDRDKLAGVFELFSSRTFAFGEREERALESLANLTIESLQLAAKPLALASEDVAVEAGEGEVPKGGVPEDIARANAPVDFPPRRFDSSTWAWAAAVVACSVLLAVVVIAPSEWRKAATPPATASRSQAETAAASSQTISGDSAMANSSTESANEKKSSAKPNGTNSREDSDTDSIPAGSLSVYADGKEVFHLTPARAQAQADEAEQGTAVPRAARVEPENIVELLPAPDPAIVVKSVQPAYPKEARRQHIQGPVVLDVHIGSSGEVQDVRTISGASVLAKASVEAVKKWTFQPRAVDGRAVEMQTRVTLNFRLPE